ncbi:MAG: hypothetical protein FWE95_01295 [Planctomycetaceae bacterium]|nr:hypothetical protein [Planctomycetaceae bacterium]
MQGENMQTIFYRSLFLLLTMAFVSGSLRSQYTQYITDAPRILPEKVIQIKVGVIVGNNVFSYDGFQQVNVVYLDNSTDETIITVPYSSLQWFAGDMATKTIHPAPLPTSVGMFKSESIKSTDLRLQWDDERIQRWNYKDDSFWCIPERVVFSEGALARSTLAYNERYPVLLRTDHNNTILNMEASEKRFVNTLDNRYGGRDIERIELISEVTNLESPFRTGLPWYSPFTDERFQSVSFLPPLYKPPLYSYTSCGFDFLPISRDRWQFCTLIVNTADTVENGKLLRKPRFIFTLWEAHRHIAEQNGVNGHENKWTVLSQSLLAWGGKFFAVPIKNAVGDLPSFHLIRDSAPCYILNREEKVMTDEFLRSYVVSGELYHLNIAEKDKVDEGNKPFHGGILIASSQREWDIQTVHCEKPVLDPEKHRIIALIYVEPEGKVYGFGKDFYVRLDVLPENDDLISAIVPCRDITAGEVSGHDPTGKERTIGEPFRTVWQAATVLFEAR